VRIAINAVLLGGVETGVELYIRALIRSLAKTDSKNEYVIFTNRDAANPDVGETDRFKIHRTGFSQGQRLRRIMWEQMELPKILERENVDLLHAPAYVMPLRCRVPCVVTMHDILAVTHPHFCKRLNALHYGFMLPRTALRAARIIASSQATKDAVLERFGVPLEKVVVISPGVDEVFCREEDRGALAAAAKRIGLPENYILFVGRLEPKKNVGAVLDAYRWLRENRALQHKLVLVGPQEVSDPAVSRAVGAQHAAPLHDVIRLSNLSASELCVAYNLADVLVFPSWVEGFGFPPLEAMACGAPVVASNIPVLRETLGDAAITVPPDDWMQLAVAVQKVLTNAFLRRILAERGLARARRFRWQDTAQRVLGVYEEALRYAPR
jgi:glycosyltransferase involved in cell wall biosynthesis